VRFRLFPVRPPPFFQGTCCCILSVCILFPPVDKCCFCNRLLLGGASFIDMFYFSLEPLEAKCSAAGAALGCQCYSCICTMPSAQLTVQHLFLKVLGLGTAVLLCLQTGSFKTCYFGKKKKKKCEFQPYKCYSSLLIAVLNVLHQTSFLLSVLFGSTPTKQLQVGSNVPSCFP